MNAPEVYELDMLRADFRRLAAEYGKARDEVILAHDDLAACKVKLARVEAWMSNIGERDPYVTDLRAALKGEP